MAEEDQKEIRIIKKYPNRRLYDTAISSYITLTDVKKMILEGTNVEIIDARTKEDITHSTLLQIIVDQEESGPPIFTKELLQNMIRFYSGSFQGLMRQWFEQSFAMFNQMNPQQSEVWQKDQMPWMQQWAKNNMSVWENLQGQWTKQFMQKQAEPELEGK